MGNPTDLQGPPTDYEAKKIGFSDTDRINSLMVFLYKSLDFPSPVAASYESIVIVCL